jgi:hypothetical protein
MPFIANISVNVQSLLTDNLLIIFELDYLLANIYRLNLII